MKKILSMDFKGERTYLQGGDFYNALSALAHEIAPAAFVERLAFRQFTDKACEVCSEAPADPTRIVGQVRWRLAADQSLPAWLVQTEQPVKGRRAFDEERLLAPAQVDAATRCAHLPARSIYTPIEDVIALTKRLNYAVCPTIEGKWVFGQLDLVQALDDDYEQLDIRMKSLMAGRFSVNEIFVDQRLIGTLRFITGAPS